MISPTLSFLDKNFNTHNPHHFYKYKPQSLKKIILVKIS